MGQLEIRTEFEVWTAFVLSKPRVGSDYKVQEKVGREATGLKKQFRDLCTAAIEKHQFHKLEFVAAMYKVTWEETRIALHEARQPHLLPDGTVGLRRVTARSMPLISFPWLFPREMCRIAREAEKLAELQLITIQEPNNGACNAGAWGTELELEGMDSTRTRDGQIVHRGETLRLFRHHNGDDEEGFYCNEGMLDPEPPRGAASGGEGAAQVLPPADFPTQMDLGTLLDAQLGYPQHTTQPSSGSNMLDLPSLGHRDWGTLLEAQLEFPQHTNQASRDSDVFDPRSRDDLDLLDAQPEFPKQTTQASRSSDLLDLLSSDEPTGIDWSSACLAPTKLPPQQPSTTTNEPTQPALAVSVSSSSTTDHHQQKQDDDPNKNGEEETNKPATESVISGSNNSWDRVTSPGLEDPSGADWEPVECIALSATGLTLGGKRLDASDLWGPVSSVPRVNPGEGDVIGLSHGFDAVAGGGEGDGQDEGEVEYEEAIIEVEEETVMERATRFVWRLGMDIV